jgi:mitochondrial fission protein ELM1
LISIFNGMEIIWIISEGSPGHLAQSRGLADALKNHDSHLGIFEIRIGRRFTGVQRSLIRWLMGSCGKRFPSFLRAMILKDVLLPEVRPDLILSSGGKSVFTGRLLADQFDVPYVFIGERKPYPSEWFHTVFTPSPMEQGIHDVAINLIPTGVTPEKVAQAASSYGRPEGKLWAMVIGGASRSHPYSEQDWRQLAEGMNVLSKEYGTRWLLTTSRRTGTDAERILKESIHAEVLADAIWWGDKPEKRMLALLGIAETVCVTQDSLTMVTECVASGKPIMVVRPESETFPRDSFMPQYLQRLENHDYILRVRISGMAHASNLNIFNQAPSFSIEEKMVNYLHERLK